MLTMSQTLAPFIRLCQSQPRKEGRRDDEVDGAGSAGEGTIFVDWSGSTMGNFNFTFHLKSSTFLERRENRLERQAEGEANRQGGSQEA